MRGSLGGSRERLIEKVLNDFLHGLAIDELAMGQNFIEDQSKAEDIGAAVDVSIAAGQLGCHVKGRAVTATHGREGGVFVVPHLGVGDIRFAPNFGEAPVDDVGNPELARQNIRRLKVTMNYATRMCVGHSLGGTSKNIDQCRQRKSSSSSSITLSQSIDDVAQITPAHMFHREK